MINKFVKNIGSAFLMVIFSSTLLINNAVGNDFNINPVVNSEPVVNNGVDNKDVSTDIIDNIADMSKNIKYALIVAGVLGVGSFISAEIYLFNYCRSLNKENEKLNAQLEDKVSKEIFAKANDIFNKNMYSVSQNLKLEMIAELAKKTSNDQVENLQKSIEKLNENYKLVLNKIEEISKLKENFIKINELLNNKVDDKKVNESLDLIKKLVNEELGKLNTNLSNNIKNDENKINEFEKTLKDLDSNIFEKIKLIEQNQYKQDDMIKQLSNKDIFKTLNDTQNNNTNEINENNIQKSNQENLINSLDANVLRKSSRTPMPNQKIYNDEFKTDFNKNKKKKSI